MVDAFFLETPKDNRKKALAVDPAKGKTEKSYTFQSTVEMKQPHTITEPYWLFPWNFKKASAISYGAAFIFPLVGSMTKAFLGYLWGALRTHLPDIRTAFSVEKISVRL